jgi:hypothetical protein
LVADGLIPPPTIVVGFSRRWSLDVLEAAFRDRARRFRRVDQAAKARETMVAKRRPIKAKKKAGTK